MVSRVRVSVGATVPGPTQYSSERLEVFEETETDDPTGTRQALYEQLNAYVQEWKKTLPKPQSKRVRVEAEPQPIFTDNPYQKSTLWRPSSNKPNLRTIKITNEVLNDPDLKRLIEMVRQTKTLRVLDKRYSIFKAGDGMEFLSEWSKYQSG